MSCDLLFYDGFIKNLTKLEVGETIVYVASTHESAEKVKYLAEQFSSKKFTVDYNGTNDDKIRLVIKRDL